MPSSPLRKFAPTPVETTTRSSKQTEQTYQSSLTPKPRRFAPEPVETTSISSKGRKNEGQKDDPPKPRRFAPQPVETTHSSSKDRPETGKPHIRFSPQPFETTHVTHRTANDATETQLQPGKQSTRRFAPVLIDTAKRSRKTGDSVLALDITDKTEQGHLIHAREHRRHITGTKSPMPPDPNDAMHDAGKKGGPLDLSSIDISTNLKRPVSPSERSRGRTHSFRCPDLDTIESSESDRGSSPSFSSSSPGQGSPITASDSSFNEFKHATRIRESVDENFSHYFLQLEAKRAEKRLREQALAAFPNSDFHEPIQHYVNEDKDTDSDVSLDDRPATWEGHEDETLANTVRRETTKIPWEQLEMQRHAEKLDQDRKANQLTAAEPNQGPWWTPAFDAAQSDIELQSMRERARPPMLGNDIVFPRCRSPQPARFDVTQGSTALRAQMCYLTEHAESEVKKSSEERGLWKGARTRAKGISTVRKRSSNKSDAAKGLWGGFCVGDDESTQAGLAPPSQSTGLMTPREEAPNPFEQALSKPNTVASAVTPALRTPPTPASSLNPAKIGTIDSVLVSDDELDRVMQTDFPDSFVTQVYNYLSLGYPSLARPFDRELSKIARVPMGELRRDDAKARAAPKGYIRLGQDFEGGGGVESEESCARWRALKAYIREWARQEKSMVGVDGPGGNWGTTARRGSWAI